MAYKPICWEFSDIEDPPIPIIPIIISTSKKRGMNLDFKIDSGYAGSLGINSDVVEKLNLKKMGLTPILTPTGKKNLPYYLIYVENENWGLKLSKAYAIETPRLLAGRYLFRNTKILLDFQEGQTCVLLSDS
ncbi:MAG: hypothetical protein ACXAC7_23175 [Candidatus Hodarchaeales archaeon]|jgi:predicted aspartyl protease